MELRQLKYFLAVADQRSFVNAANVLYISRQAISKAVSQLEQELQVELFMRDSSGAFLTPAGVLFYDRVRGTVTELEQLRQEMLSYGTRYRQRLRLAFSIGTLSLFESALEHFSAMQKNADIAYAEYPQQQCTQLLLERHVDAAIIANAAESDSYERIKLTQCSFGILLQQENPLAKKSSLRLAHLQDLPVAVHAESPLRARLEHVRYTGYDYGRLMRLAIEGKCALLLPELPPAQIPAGLCWRSIEDAPPWIIFVLRQKSSGIASLPGTLLDELQRQLLSSDQKGGDGRK